MLQTSDSRSIAHFDLDAFFVNVEYLGNARLRGKPIAVGGHSDRGVTKPGNSEFIPRCPPGSLKDYVPN